ncbi:MAG: efflux RND transporter periplasmic adaptor subunit [Gammaproteobacteria bacterium]
MIKRLVLVVLLLFAMFGGIFGWKFFMGQRMAAMMSQPPPPATVASAEVQVETWQPYLHSVGSVEATQGVFVTTEVAGQIKEILFRSGQQVQTGDVLLKLDDSVDQAEYKGRIAMRDLARLQFTRGKKLVADRTISQSEYDELQAQLDNAEATVNSKYASLAKKKIRAPFAGLLGIRQVDLGEYLSPGVQIVPLQALDPVYVDYALPERNFEQLSVGQPILVEVQAYPGRIFAGSISAINPGIDPGTRTVRLRATLDNSEQLLRPGMFAEVRTALPARDGILTLPRTAISYNPYGESVFLIKDQDGVLVVQSRQIKTGEIRQGRVEIIKGLRAGDQVVVAGQVKLRNGQPVVIDNSVQLKGEVSGG